MKSFHPTLLILALLLLASVVVIFNQKVEAYGIDYNQFEVVVGASNYSVVYSGPIDEQPVANGGLYWVLNEVKSSEDSVDCLLGVSHENKVEKVIVRSDRNDRSFCRALKSMHPELKVEFNPNS